MYYLNQRIIPWVKAYNMIPQIGFVNHGVNFLGMKIHE